MTDTPRDPLAALQWALDCLDAVDEGRSPDGGTTPSIDYQRNKAAARATLDATRPSGDEALRERVWSAQHDVTCDEKPPHRWSDHLPWDDAETEQAAIEEADAIIAALRDREA